MISGTAGSAVGGTCALDAGPDAGKAYLLHSQIEAGETGKAVVSRSGTLGAGEEAGLTCLAQAEEEADATLIASRVRQKEGSRRILTVRAAQLARHTLAASRIGHVGSSCPTACSSANWQTTIVGGAFGTALGTGHTDSIVGIIFIPAFVAGGWRTALFALPIGAAHALPCLQSEGVHAGCTVCISSRTYSSALRTEILLKQTTSAHPIQLKKPGTAFLASIHYCYD